jgi:hypothetical protein
MKVFLNISFRSEESSKKAIKKIKAWLVNRDHKLTYNCFENGIDSNTTDIEDSESEDLYLNALKSLTQSDIVILEVSTNSFTQGYILQKSLEMGKPVIALHQRNKYSIFIKGIKNNLLQTLEYDEYTLEQQLENAIDFAIDNLMSKFNFYLSSDINSYLNWIAKKKKLPKSEFVRELIRGHMDANKEYLSSLS